MKYIAHKDNGREQTIEDHLTGTARLAGKFAKAFGKEEWGYCCGMLHDIGKYSNEFQRKITEDTGMCCYSNQFGRSRSRSEL